MTNAAKRVVLALPSVEVLTFVVGKSTKKTMAKDAKKRRVIDSSTLVYSGNRKIMIDSCLKMHPSMKGVVKGVF
jgi:hypothetical protein